MLAFRLRPTILVMFSSIAAACSPMMRADVTDVRIEAGLDAADVAGDIATADANALDANDAIEVIDDVATHDAGDVVSDSPCGCASEQSCCGTSCVDLATDPRHCGACTGDRAVCPGTTCVAGACTTACRAPFADCDGLADTGCEVDSETDALHCGACDVACAAGQVCSAGRCVCAAGAADCNGDLADGCELDITDDPRHCGGCATVCSAGDACSAGTCITPACAAGRAECNGVGSDGCEVDVTTDPNHCGACSMVCSFANATPQCVAGSCVRGACGDGYGDCNGMAPDGCETDVRVDVANCGTCGTMCSAPRATTACTAGACTIATCDTGFGDCNGDIVDGCERVLDTVTDCGACGHACAPRANATVACAEGRCVYACIAPAGDCDGDLNASESNGCEADLTTATRCGSCEPAASCLYGGATFTCSYSGTYACTATRCTDGAYDNCNADSSDGCERFVGFDNFNCGRCGFACAAGEFCRFYGPTGACAAGGNSYGCYGSATGTTRCPPAR